MTPERRTRLFALFLVLCSSLSVLPSPALAATGDFSDVPSKHYAHQAVQYLRQQGMLDGYSDGTFRPEQEVNRAEALKIITSTIIPDGEKSLYKTSAFGDVASNAWYLPYVEWAARKKKIIDGPPTKPNFFPGRTVTKAEFIKMFLVSRDVNPNSFGDITLPLSSDVRNTKEWFYPYMRFAISSSMTTLPSSGLYSPNRALTRGDVALLMHRYYLYRAGHRIQDVFTETEKDIDRALAALEKGNAQAADEASARALLMIRGAREIRPNETMVKVIVKIAEGYRALVRSYRSGEQRDWKNVVKHAQDAWYLGDQARKISPNAASLATQLQQYATSLANQGRSQL